MGVPNQAPSLESGDLEVVDKEKTLFTSGAVANNAGAMGIIG